MHGWREPCSMNAEGQRAVRRTVGHWVRYLWACILLLWAVPAHARTVAVLRPEPADALVLETSSRIHGELLAVGFSVRVITLPRPADPEQAPSEWLNTLKEQHHDAALEVQDTSPPKVDVWMLPPGAAPRRVAEVSVDAGTENAPEKLAIRAIEVLRSAFLERDLLERQSAAPTSSLARPDTARDTAPPASTSSTRFGLSAGVATLTSLDGVGPALMPTLRIDLAATSTLTVYAAGAGFGTRSRVAAGAHSVDVRHSHAVLGARYFFSTGAFRPFAALALGAMATSIEAHAASPAQGHDRVVNAFLMDAGLGLDWLWHERYFTSLATDVHVANPSATVHVVDSAVASTGLPNLALTLTVGAWL